MRKLPFIPDLVATNTSQQIATSISCNNIRSALNTIMIMLHMIEIHRFQRPGSKLTSKAIAEPVLSARNLIDEGEVLINAQARLLRSELAKIKKNEASKCVHWI